MKPTIEEVVLRVVPVRTVCAETGLPVSVLTTILTGRAIPSPLYVATLARYTGASPAAVVKRLRAEVERQMERAQVGAKFELARLNANA